jgi:acyl-CoA synthetase (AMP-forming)/AMP-acid ligase II
VKQAPPAEGPYLEHLRGLWAQRWPTGFAHRPEYAFGEIPLTEYLRHRARRQPDTAACIFYGTEMTFARLDALSDRFARLLAAHNVRRGDRVAVFLPNCPQFAIAFFGVLKLGCIHVPVNPLFKEHELEYELQDSGAEVIVAQDQLFGLVESVWSNTSLRLALTTNVADMLPDTPTIPVPASIRLPRLACEGAIDLLSALEAVTAATPLPEVGLDDMAALNYTGGTTGLPKGCIHTQRDMLYTAATYCGIASQTRADDVSLCFYPVFWIAGENMGLTFPVFTGTTCVLLARWDPLAFLAATERHRVTNSAMLVDNVVELMDHPRFGDYDLRTLRKLRVSSFVKKLGIDHRRRWEALTGVTLIESAWGMTETHTCDTFTSGMQDGDMDLRSQPVFVGLPVPGTEFQIRDFRTGELCPLGTEGELWVHSPSLLKGYWQKPEETARSLRDGWLATGDIGLIDTDGYIHYLGRRKEMLKVNGMSVFPTELEGLLGRHPQVVGSAVIGRADAARGEVPVAFVRLTNEGRATLTESELVAWCREHMAVYKVPEIHFVDEFPLTATGKIKKDELALSQSHATAPAAGFRS